MGEAVGEQGPCGEASWRCGASVRSGKRVGFSAAKPVTGVPDQRTHEGSGPEDSRGLRPRGLRRAQAQRAQEGSGLRRAQAQRAHEGSGPEDSGGLRPRGLTRAQAQRAQEGSGPEGSGGLRPRGLTRAQAQRTHEGSGPGGAGTGLDGRGCRSKGLYWFSLCQQNPNV